MKKFVTLLALLFSFYGKTQSPYFPPTTGTAWDTASAQSLGWCQDKLDTFINYLGNHNTKAFILLKDGKIVAEKYYNTFTEDSVWYWASAGKSLTAFLIGLAQEQGYLNIQDSLPKYLGHGFSSCSAGGEDSIRIIHQLTMTTGFDDMPNGATSESHCTDDTCLMCMAPPSTRWAYHNAPYTMTHWVLDSATGMTVNAFKNQNLNGQTGITGQFFPSGYDDVYFSKARSFARFGLLMLNHGKWDTAVILHDTNYFNAMVNTSQSINLSYGYLWWLNGKASYHLPGTQFQFNGQLMPDAPPDMIAALGKNDQILNIIPSMNLVLIRMGNPMFPSVQEAPNFANDSIWVKLRDVFCNTPATTNVIPPDRRVDWTLAGLQQPIPVYTSIADITAFGGVGNGSTPNDAAFQAATLSLGSDSGVVYFPAGNYAFTSPVSLRSGLVLRGQNAASTTLQFNLSGDNELITMEGSATGIITLLAAPANKNDYSILVNDASQFSSGDYVKLFQNDSSLVFDIYHSVGQVLHVRSVSGNTITFYSPLRRSYALAFSPQLQKLSMIVGAGVECLKIKRLDSTATQRSNIFLNYAARCWVKGVESDSANFAHVSLNTSTNLEVTGCFMHGSFGYGTGGMGYGVSTNRTTGECLIENNIFRHLRHAIIVQSGSNGNVYSLNYAREGYKSEGAQHTLVGDIVLHGNYPYANLFEGNIVNNIVVDVSHGINGPFNTFFRNRAELFGILFSNGSGDSSNIVGNEVTNVTGNYLLAGNGNFEYGNNIQGIIRPGGTDSLRDYSYYYSHEPYFWYFALPFPTIGIPHPINTGTIPAAANFNAGNFTDCSFNVLSVESLLLFGEKRDGKNLLTWQVNNSNETKSFEVERSIDGHDFLKLSSVAAVTSATYSYVDRLPSKGLNFYRIIQLLKTGNKVYSKVIILNNGEETIIKLYPNPANDRLIIASNELLKNMQLTIESTVGQALRKIDLRGLQSNNATINVSSLAKGIYFVEALDNFSGRRIVQKLIKQ